MYGRRLIYPLFGGLGLTFILLGVASQTRAALEAHELPLNSLGAAFEINADDQGWLWISDYGAGEVWGLAPQDRLYKVYPVGGAPSDARHDGEYLWWADDQAGSLGQVSTQDGSYTRWQVPGVAGFYGTALDPQGRLYAIDFDRPYLYRLDPAAGQLCTYTLPAEGVSIYLVADTVSLWLGDYVNGRILRLRTADGHMDWWTLPEDSTPFGMALDQDGSLWYADLTYDSLSRLEPDIGRLSSYALPYGDEPAMVAVEGEWVWYSEQGQGSVGVLKPGSASPSLYTAPMGNMSLNITCTEITPADSGYLATRTEGVNWFNTTYTSTVNDDGWQAFRLPAGALPWGIAATDAVWLVDSGRKSLARIPIIPMQDTMEIFLPLLVR
jgi:streptogramin lyase